MALETLCSQGYHAPKEAEANQKNVHAKNYRKHVKVSIKIDTNQAHVVPNKRWTEIDVLPKRIEILRKVKTSTDVAVLWGRKSHTHNPNETRSISPKEVSRKIKSDKETERQSIFSNPNHKEKESSFADRLTPKRGGISRIFTQNAETVEEIAARLLETTNSENISAYPEDNVVRKANEETRITDNNERMTTENVW